MLVSIVVAIAAATALPPQDSMSVVAPKIAISCLLGHLPYVFGEWNELMDGGSIIGTVTDASGLAEMFRWNCQLGGADRGGGEDIVHLGVTLQDLRGGRAVLEATKCEAEIIEALRTFADTKLARRLQVDLVAAIHDRAALTAEAERALRSPEPLPRDATWAAYVARQLETAIRR